MSRGVLDHFPGLTLSEIWTAVTAASGSVTVSNGQVAFEDTASEDAAFIYPAQLDITKNQTWGFMVRSLAGSAGDVIALWSRSTAPNAALRCCTRRRAPVVGAANRHASNADPSRPRRRPAADGHWNGTAWTTAGTAADAITIAEGTDASWYFVQLELDPTLGLRWAVQHAGDGQSMTSVMGPRHLPYRPHGLGRVGPTSQPPPTMSG